MPADFCLDFDKILPKIRTLKDTEQALKNPRKKLFALLLDYYR